MSNPNARRCVNCEHWVAMGSGRGDCRRFPPMLWSGGPFGQMAARWPETDAYAACGEFSLAPVGRRHASAAVVSAP